MARAEPRPSDPPTPRRTCVGCRSVRAPEELTRVVRTPEGSLAVGRTLPGRGAWLCNDSPTCLDQAIRRGGFARSFRTPVTAHAAGVLREAIARLEGTSI